MVLLDMYGRIQPTIISQKLGVGICNPAPDWIEGLQEKFKKEVLIHKHDIESFKKSGIDVSLAIGRYDFKNIVEQLGWQEANKSDAQIIAEHLIEIQVLDFNHSLLQLKNDHLDSPTCEPQYTRKFLRFCGNVQSAKAAQRIIPCQIPFSTYNSDEYNTTPLIINYLEGMLSSHPDHRITVDESLAGGIQSLKYIGRLIDDFLVAESDFWLLDYIINATFFDGEFNAYHVFKTMSLIEMLIINPNKHGKTHGEMERKLPQFLPERIPEGERALFSEIMRKLRNKIGHGDFAAVQELLKQYRESFMQNFWYDEFENSIETWTYGNICLNLDEALNEILWLMLSDRAQLIALQNS